MQVYKIDTPIKVSEYLWWNKTTKKDINLLTLDCTLNISIPEKNLLEKDIFCGRLNT